MDCRLSSWELALCCDTSAVDDTLLDRSKAAAIHTIDRITGFRYGTCLLPVFPCKGCPDRCSRCPECRGVRVDLFPLAGRIESISAVTVDGVTISADDYRLESNRYLIPLNPGALWPLPVQTLNTFDVAGTWGVLVLAGELVPENVLVAASDLACQFVAYCSPDRDCAIPENAVSVTREGISVRLDTGLDMIPTVKFLRQTYSGRPRRKVGIFDPARFPRGHVPT